MADDQPVWGIEVGQAALKAIKLRPDPVSGRVVAEAFDLVQHPKILSQPDAVPAQLIAEAFETFLSRNSLKGCRVAMSLPGQSALARFIQLPPVESSQIAKIVEYEARQQIPFALEEVIWDYQPLGGGLEEGGYTLEAEVGLFAMKRDQVEMAMAPFLDRKIEVDLVQIAPLALYNFLTFDRLGMREGKEFDAPDEYTMVCDLGADNSTLLISNGDKIWIRNVNVGGNHFTRALVKDQKLTFAKAEHLKCNATKAPDPRAVFQALRPVFNDYVAEIQRSIGYFSSVNREAKITRVLGVGNGFKLAGLQKFLQQNLQHPVERVDQFKSAVGDEVLNDATFRDNVAGFVVPYGVALQAAGLTRITTSLVPPEIIQERKIRKKKPWAALAAGVLLAGVSLGAAGYGNYAESVSEQLWAEPLAKVPEFKTKVDGFRSGYDEQLTKIEDIKSVGEELTKPASGRIYWPEVLRAIAAVVPADPTEELTKPIEQRESVLIKAITFKKEPDLSTWYATLPPLTKEVMNDMAKAEQEERKKAKAAADAAQYAAERAAAIARGEDPPPPPEPEPAPEPAADGETDPALAGPTGEGYVVTLKGVHYHDGSSPEDRDAGYLRRTVLANLREWTLNTPVGEVPVAKLGIRYPALLPITARQIPYDPEGRTVLGTPAFGGRGGGSEYGEESYDGPPDSSFGGRGTFGSEESGSDYGPAGQPAGRPPIDISALDSEEPEKNLKLVTEYPFTIQFVWKKTPPAERTELPSEDVPGAEGEAAASAPTYSEGA
ncbi:type IV pilus assembly protein PilM [Alienimonas californiensis]|uniref:Competence protein A n=1 Tax=Alienimonas californiensis TaxID=2527989 RepID=A0A517PAP5_9PLAN|nr:type IV pilus assembly protein PilM [Alienimonas californiensis]QDT16443.1 Competence protein A [Alienimonas californiensis]